MTKEELKEEQGIRSNIEAKKMKDAMGSAGEVAMGAGKEALKNSGWQVFEQLTAAGFQLKGSGWYATFSFSIVLHGVFVEYSEHVTQDIVVT